MGNKTWKVVDLPPGSNPIVCNWIFKRKMKVDSTIDKFKTILVAKEFTQKEGIDYFDTYAPIARITSIRMLISYIFFLISIITQQNFKSVSLS